MRSLESLPELGQLQHLLLNSENLQDAQATFKSFKSSFSRSQNRPQITPISFSSDYELKTTIDHRKSRFIVGFNMFLAILQLADGNEKESLQTLAIVSEILLQSISEEGLIPVQSFPYWPEIISSILDALNFLMLGDGQTDEKKEEADLLDPPSSTSHYFARWAESDFNFVISVFQPFVELVSVIRLSSHQAISYFDTLSTLTATLIEFNTTIKAKILSESPDSIAALVLKSISENSTLSAILGSLSSTDAIRAFWKNSPFTIPESFETYDVSLTFVNPKIFDGKMNTEEQQLILSEQTEANNKSPTPNITSTQLFPPITKNKRPKPTKSEINELPPKKSKLNKNHHDDVFGSPAHFPSLPSYERLDRERKLKAERRFRIDKLKATRRAYNLSGIDTQRVDAELRILEQEDTSDVDDSPLPTNLLPTRTPLTSSSSLQTYPLVGTPNSNPRMFRQTAFNPLGGRVHHNSPATTPTLPKPKNSPSHFINQVHTFLPPTPAGVQTIMAPLSALIYSQFPQTSGLTPQTVTTASGSPTPTFSKAPNLAPPIITEGEGARKTPNGLTPQVGNQNPGVRCGPTMGFDSAKDPNETHFWTDDPPKILDFSFLKEIETIVSQEGFLDLKHL
ncbi:hypothetical protein BLNAU_7060 [Blattamonas nauphoetae]|uniref:Uncharacterized protein n=1 Tax=Blattamonas nauphoetae TaxID=2049346 RepID=A0ABQ9Y2C2_9EUKA|nr:hypothetical protein BLNAU_7060 [Blattamonas nauphoetae]